MLLARTGREALRNPPLMMQPEMSGLVSRFHASMEINYEKWHDGVGYDISLLAEASPSEFSTIETFLVTRSVHDWRDVEALAALGTERAKELLRTTLETGSPELRVAVMRHAPDHAGESERIESLVKGLESATFFHGLSAILDEVSGFHPPEVMAALFRGLRQRGGEEAVHFAAMLFHLHGKSEEPFDWNHRDFFLRFHTEDPEDREAAIADLCAKMEVSME